MTELPETIIIAQQANTLLAGKKIAHIFNATKKHRFTFFHGAPEKYGEMLQNLTIQSVIGYGMFIDIILTNNTILSIGEGTNIRYGESNTKVPQDYQLLITFSDDSFLFFTVSLYGSIGVYPNTNNIDERYHILNKQGVPPTDKKFTKEYFFELINKSKTDLSAKALIATEQRIPGIGNGTAQDILFNAGVNPKRKLSSLSDQDKENLYLSLKDTIKKMILQKGRNTQCDIWGKKGEYETILSSKTWKNPCPICGSTLIKEAYLGGAIYYCPHCQPKD